LNARIGEHRNHIRRNSTQNSVITDRLQFKHEFDWDDVEVLDEEKNYKKRFISEIIHIKKQLNGLIYIWITHNDTDLLDPIYNNLIRS